MSTTATPGADLHPEDASRTNQTLVRRFFDRLDADDVVSLGGLISDDWTLTGGPRPPASGIDGLPELQCTSCAGRHTWRVGQVLISGDLVAVRATDRHERQISFGAPTEVLDSTFVMRVEDGRITHTWRGAGEPAHLLRLVSDFRAAALRPAQRKSLS